VVLARLVRRYDILPPSSLAHLVSTLPRDGEGYPIPSVELKRTMLKFKLGVTMTPTNAKVALRRREVAA